MVTSGFLKGINKNYKFIGSVYLTLIFQLIITFFIVYFYNGKQSLNKLIIYIIGCFISIFVIIFTQNIWIKFLFFIILSVVFGFIIQGSKPKISKEKITQALLGTIGIFLLFSIAGYTLLSMGIDIGWMGIILISLLLITIIWGIILLLFRDSDNNNTAYKVYLWFGLALFGLYVIFDTNQIKKRDNFVDAALLFYLDFINIFVRIVSLRGN